MEHSIQFGILRTEILKYSDQFMPRNIIKVLEKNFSDMKAGEKMLISSPEVISNYISKIPVGTTITPKEMRHALAKEKGADNTCPTTTGIFLRIAIEEHALF